VKEPLVYLMFAVLIALAAVAIIVVAFQLAGDGGS
jgi:hypothetical protein